MDVIQLQVLRLAAQVALLEKLVLKHALLGLGSSQALSIEERQQALESWLDENTNAADAAFGKKFRGDAAMTGLYAEELQEVAKAMKTEIEELAAEALGRPPNHSKG